MRPVPENPYLPAPHADPPLPRHRGRHFRLPAALPHVVSSAFARPASARQEAGALLYGVRGTDVGDVDPAGPRLDILPQIGHRTQYRIPLSRSPPPRRRPAPGLVTVGQVHSHPGEDVEHSWYDDRHAISTRAVSFVLPNYGLDAAVPGSLASASTTTWTAGGTSDRHADRHASVFHRCTTADPRLARRGP